VSAEIEQALGAKPELVKGDNGIFDVAADGRLVFSKDREHRFPKPGEIVQELQKPAAGRR
jgi:selT/selW/selH-like putative selenoprotein